MHPDNETPEQPLPTPDTGPHAAPPLEEQGTDANGSPVEPVLAMELAFKPHPGAQPGDAMSRFNHELAGVTAMNARDRLQKAASAAFAEAYKIPVDHIVMYELSSIDPDGTHRVSFYFVNQNEAQEAAMDADLRLAIYFKEKGWHWREDGALMKPCGFCFRTGAPENDEEIVCSNCQGAKETIEREAPKADA